MTKKKIEPATDMEIENLYSGCTCYDSFRPDGGTGEHDQWCMKIMAPRIRARIVAEKAENIKLCDELAYAMLMNKSKGSR